MKYTVKYAFSIFRSPTIQLALKTMGREGGGDRFADSIKSLDFSSKWNMIERIGQLEEERGL